MNPINLRRALEFYGLVCDKAVMDQLIELVRLVGTTTFDTSQLQMQTEVVVKASENFLAFAKLLPGGKIIVSFRPRYPNRKWGWFVTFFLAGNNIWYVTPENNTYSAHFYSRDVKLYPSRLEGTYGLRIDKPVF